MIKARKKFVRYAMLSVFILLTVLLGIINIISFTMASEDADQMTLRLSEEQGIFSPDRQAGRNVNPVMDPAGNRSQMFPGGFFGQPGATGPDAPDTPASLRYFTYAFDQSGNGEKIAFSISAVTEEEALTWAQSLLKEKETGWTAGNYRYRVYLNGGKTYVTVIDQSRELVTPYRILYISLGGLVLALGIGYLFLMYLGKRMFQPLEEADRRQKRFIADAEKEFRVPLTVINANTEIIERESGESEQTRSINRQVKRMIALIRTLGSAGIFEEKDMVRTGFDLSSLVRSAGEGALSGFTEKGLTLQVSAEEPIEMEGDSESMGSLITELLDNARKFALTHAELSVSRFRGRITLTASNDTDLPDGSVDQVFDRFTRLDNAKDADGMGLGLSRVREIAKAHNGRVKASVTGGIFTLTVNL